MGLAWCFRWAVFASCCFLLWFWRGRVRRSARIGPAVANAVPHAGPSYLLAYGRGNIVYTFSVTPPASGAIAGLSAVQLPENITSQGDCHKPVSYTHLAL